MKKSYLKTMPSYKQSTWFLPKYLYIFQLVFGLIYLVQIEYTLMWGGTQLNNKKYFETKIWFYYHAICSSKSICVEIKILIYQSVLS